MTWNEVRDLFTDLGVLITHMNEVRDLFTDVGVLITHIAPSLARIVHIVPGDGPCHLDDRHKDLTRLRCFGTQITYPLTFVFLVLMGRRRRP